MTGQLLTQQDVADYLQTTVRTLRRWRTERTGPPYVKWGTGASAKIRYRLEAVDAWLEAGGTPARRRPGRPRREAAS
jgi:hypothetical protein